jgi:NAD-dependent dihydropyrimidine dehydrogenase PreA subunit
MMSKTLKNGEVEKLKTGTVIHGDGSAAKMEVEETEVKSEGDYRESPVYIYHDWCKKCGICVSFCPTGTLASKPDGSPYVKHPEKCIHCEMCDRLCPDFAITGAKEK